MPLMRRLAVYPFAAFLCAAGCSSADGGAPKAEPKDAAARRDGSLGAPHDGAGACDALGAVGVWENITPQQVSLDPNFRTPAGTNYGAHSFVLNPQNSATVYLGTSAQGLYKSTDCGAHWVHINTGKNADAIDGGRQWTMVIDPVDPMVLYTNSGYGTRGSKAWKSVNGGVDWEPFISAEYIKALQFGDFVAQLTLDPTQHEHLIVTPHFECEVGAVGGLPKTKNCLLETTDAGKTWKILEGTPAAGEGAGQWMVDAKTWFWAAYFGGLFRTTDAGSSWQHVFAGGYATGSSFQVAGGKLYTGGVFSVLVSTDGSTWRSLENSPGADRMTGDAKTIFVARNTSYHSAPASNPTTWTALPSPAFAKPDAVQAWGLTYDPDHHVLYSLNGIGGFWRMRTE